MKYSPEHTAHPRGQPEPHPASPLSMASSAASHSLSARSINRISSARRLSAAVSAGPLSRGSGGLARARSSASRSSVSRAIFSSARRAAWRSGSSSRRRSAARRRAVRRLPDCGSPERVLVPGSAAVQYLALVIFEIPLEGPDRPVGDQPEPVGDQLEQMPVMAHQHHGAREIVDRLDQRFAGLDVEVVRRLVEDQQGGRVMGDEGKVQPRPLAAGEVAHRQQTPSPGQSRTCRAEPAPPPAYASGISAER